MALGSGQGTNVAIFCRFNGVEQINSNSENHDGTQIKMKYAWKGGAVGG